MSEPGQENFERNIKEVIQSETPEKQSGWKTKKEAKAKQSLKDQLNNEEEGLAVNLGKSAQKSKQNLDIKEDTNQSDDILKKRDR